MFIINRLEEVAQIVKNVPEHADRPKVLREELSKIVFPKSFQLPLDPYKTCRGVQIDKCRVMDSKKLPLWLTFVREDPWEPPLVVLFKSGDDLRQDQLTLQVRASDASAVEHLTRNPPNTYLFALAPDPARHGPAVEGGGP